MLLSVLITVSHSIFAHHHHQELILHHEEDDHDHNIFSLAQLGESYIVPTYTHKCLNHSVCISQSFMHIDIFLQTPIKQRFSIVKEYPPPKSYVLNSSLLRDPPSI